MCIFCCYSFYPEDKEKDKLQESYEFNKFFSEVLLFPHGDEEGNDGDSGYSRFADFVEFFCSSASIFSVCSDCWVILIRAVGRKLQVEEAEVGLTDLQKNAWQKMKRLRRGLGKYVEEMEKIEGVVSGADLRCLEIFLKGKRRKRVKKQIYKAMVLRDTILESKLYLYN